MTSLTTPDRKAVQSLPIETLEMLTRGEWRRRIVLHTPEITLKGRNQEDFRRALLRNVRHRLARAGFDWPVCGGRGRAYVDVDTESPAVIGEAMHVLAEVAGVHSLTLARWLPLDEVRTGSGAPDWAAIESMAIALARDCYRPGERFAVRVKHVDRRLRLGSRETEVRLGAAILEHSDWEGVNLDRPDCTFRFEFFPDGLYACTAKIAGIGGLPSGTGGRLLALLTGGIDSPVAAFQLARRGASIDCFHLTAAHADAAAIEQSPVGRLAAQISRYSLHTRLYAAPYTFFDLALTGRQDGYELVLFRRFLFRAAETLAGRIDAGGLIVGDCLGQVASQTLENITAVNAAVQLPVFRPLIGTNKTEIMEMARGIGTYEISIEPSKDCCALLASNPRTRARCDVVNRLEAERLPDYDTLVERTLAETVCIEYDCGEAVACQSLCSGGRIISDAGCRGRPAESP